jgi:ubiquinone/menaquinone biosynthesis C-methylase UbiE
MADDCLREVVKFYTNTEEEVRLGVGSAQLEFERTKELIRRLLPNPPAQVIDLGGGSGPYAFWLASLGYQVHLVDATPRLVSVAREQDARTSHHLSSIAVGDARRLAFDNDSVDAVLLLGPLYHMTESRDRRSAVAEARRVLRSSGVILVAGISRYAGALDGLALHPTLDRQVVAIRHGAVKDGQDRNDTGNPRYFTTAYFHRPEDLRRELGDVGFEAVRLFGVEGPGWLLADFEARWSDAAGREDILRVARLLEEEHSILGASAHLLASGRRL